MKKARVISVLLYLFVTAPIYYYLFYKILEAVKASELMWFLYWVYLPVGIISAVILKLSSDDE